MYYIQTITTIDRFVSSLHNKMYCFNNHLWIACFKNRNKSLICSNVPPLCGSEVKHETNQPLSFC